MTVGQLRDRLSNIPDDAVIGIKSDGYTFGLVDWPLNVATTEDDDGNESIVAVHLWEGKTDLSLMEDRSLCWTMEG